MENEVDTKDWCIVQDEQGKHYRVRIRKLTPTECFRLMGVKDADAEKMLSAVSKSQCYKAAGNSIVVDQMVYLFESLIFPEASQRRNIMSIAQRINIGEYSDEAVASAVKSLKSTLDSRLRRAETPEQKEKAVEPKKEDKPRYREMSMFEVEGFM